MRNLIQTKSATDVVAQAVLSNTAGFIVMIAETVGKQVERAVDIFHLRNTEEASKTIVGTDLSNKSLPPRLT